MKRNVQSDITHANDPTKKATVIDKVPVFGDMNVL
jgi:hypothetical protein